MLFSKGRKETGEDTMPKTMPEELLRHVDLMKPNQSELRQLIRRDDLSLEEGIAEMKRRAS